MEDYWDVLLVLSKWIISPLYVPGSKPPIMSIYQPNSRGVYTHYKDSVIKGGIFPIPNILTTLTMAHISVKDTSPKQVMNQPTSRLAHLDKY